MYSALHMENLIDSGEDVIVTLKMKHYLGCESVDWVQLGQIQSQVLVTKILCFWIPRKRE